MSGLSTCRDCGQWIYWQDFPAADGSTRHVPFDESGHVTLHWATCSAGEYIEVYGETYKVDNCRKCQHQVYWETTARGRKRPMDCYPDEFGTWVSDGNCHFDTCVGAGAGARAGSNWRDADPRRARSREQAAAQERPQPVSEVERGVRFWGPSLGVTWPCSAADVTSAFRKQALKHHPDMGGQAKEFIRVKRAYDALRNLVTA
jgi:hypothetical protein